MLGGRELKHMKGYYLENCLSYNFSEILSFCEGKAEYFTLTRHVKYKKRTKECAWFYDLKPYTAFRFYSKEWYQFWHPFPKWYQYYAMRPWMWKKEISVFQYNEATKKILMENIDDLFRFPGIYEGFSDAPQDICFFRKDQTILLGSVTHEFIADIYLTELEVAENEVPLGFSLKTKFRSLAEIYYTRVPLKKSEWNLEMIRPRF